MECPGQDPVQVRPGDVALVMPGVAHKIASDLHLPPTPFIQFSKNWRGKPDLAKLDMGGGDVGYRTEIITMLVWLSTIFRQSLLRFLPPLIVLRAENMRLAQGIHELLFTAVPPMFERPAGWGVTRIRLAELAIVSMLGDYFNSKDALHASDGWLKGLTDPSIAKALARIHAEPSRDWTNEALAETVAMSRSRFISRFSSLIGVAPIEYLTQYRMIAAADRLAGDKPSISDISREVGYKTEKGFARAFTRWSGGVTPAAYKKRSR